MGQERVALGDDFQAKGAHILGLVELRNKGQVRTQDPAGRNGLEVGTAFYDPFYKIIRVFATVIEPGHQVIQDEPVRTLVHVGAFKEKIVHKLRVETGVSTEQGQDIFHRIRYQ